MGDLGAADGPPITCDWTAQGLLAPLLPWLAILVLLALKPNYGWSAWWIWLPLACLAAVWQHLPGGPLRLPKEVLEVFVDVPRALAFGLAALWLLAPCLARGHRLGTFLRMLFVLAAFGTFNLAVAAGWDEGAAARLRGLPGGGYPFVAAWTRGVAQVGLLIVLALIITVAMALTGLLCRRRSLPLLCLCFVGLLPAVLLVTGALACGLVLLTLSEGAQRPNFLGFGLLVSVASLANLLPFLVLSAANALFRERLKALFYLGHQRPAPGLPVEEGRPAALAAFTSA